MPQKVAQFIISAFLNLKTQFYFTHCKFMAFLILLRKNRIQSPYINADIGKVIEDIHVKGLKKLRELTEGSDEREV